MDLAVWYVVAGYREFTVRGDVLRGTSRRAVIIHATLGWGLCDVIISTIVFDFLFESDLVTQFVAISVAVLKTKQRERARTGVSYSYSPQANFQKGKSCIKYGQLYISKLVRTENK